MKRVYADLHLCANVNDLSHVKRLASRASMLGYGLIGMSFLPRTAEQQVKQIQEICKEVGMELVSRVDLKPHTPEELLRDLRKLRRRFEVVAVTCQAKTVARQAAKDRRVDLLNFPQPDFRRAFFDMAEAELASNSLASLEIDVKPLLTLEGTLRIRLLSILRRMVQTAREFHVPIIVSSGVSEELLMRKPMELASLASLVGLHEAFAVDAVSKNPVAIVRRNREKLSWRFVAPGIRVVRRGKDC
jgi:RNase P/RNase MRP subunit p30